MRYKGRRPVSKYNTVVFVDLRTPSTSFNEKIKKGGKLIENIETFFHTD